MCGLVGLISSAGAPPLAAATAALAHRGPDDSGTFTASCEGLNVQLGHRRLSIVDLSDAGHQPMQREGVTLLFNGEIYNFETLKQTHLKGVTFHSASDTEVLLLLYLQMGLEMVQLLNGDFAIAIFDSRSALLHLIRDRFGVKPLYLYRGDTVWGFASEISAFKAAGLHLSMRPEGLATYLIFKYTPGTQTLYREVCRLQPGSVYSYDCKSRSHSHYRYWSLPQALRPADLSYREAVKGVQEHLARSIQLRLSGDVPIATFLSGGLDSSVIAWHLRDGSHRHYCAEKSAQDLQREGSTSDGRAARKLAAAWNLDLDVLDIGQSQLSAEWVARTVTACPDLIADGSMIPAMLMAERAARSHKVVLSGMGADEVFLGYNGHYLLLLDQYICGFPGLSSVARAAFRRLHPGRGPFKAYTRYLQKWALSSGKPYSAALYSLVGHSQSAQSLVRGQAGDELAQVAGPYFGSEQSFADLLHFETENFLVKNLHYLDHCSMAYGLESRVPFLDHELYTFVGSLPRSYRLSASFRGKRLLKDAYAKVLPAFILRRRKAGFGMPLRSLLAQPALLERLLPMEYLRTHPLLDSGVASTLIDRHTRGMQDHSALLYALVCFKIWEERCL